uniref:Tachykinin 1 n=1 Tax=Deroceras reticulatum TaxID=145610 RepID=A0A1X9WEG5_DERRE|nr:tachykinin 1 [Deroceras reticulatum]
MNNLLQALSLTLAVLMTCQAHAARFDDGYLDQAQSLHSLGEAPDQDVQEGNNKAAPSKKLQDSRLVRQWVDSAVLRNWLARVSHSTDEIYKRFKPSGFLGSRGKRFTPSLESLLLARYYQDAEKWKRQPHLGFHGSRG